MMTAEFAAKSAPSRLSPGGGNWNNRIGLIACRSRDSTRTMPQAESKKNARLPDKICGSVCGAVMTSRPHA
jgi:hypothetical protein